MRLRDNASAATFNTPGMCRAEKWKEYMALKKDKHRSKCDRSGVLAVLLPRMATTAMLSQWKHTWLPDHIWRLPLPLAPAPWLRSQSPPILSATVPGTILLQPRMPHTQNCRRHPSRCALMGLEVERMRTHSKPAGSDTTMPSLPLPRH